MKHTGPRQRLTVYLAEPRRHHQHFVVTRVMERAREQGMSGGTVIAGFAGFGRHRHLHQARLWHGSDETPLVLMIVDKAERIQMLLPQLRTLLPDALVVVDEVETIRYSRPHHSAGHSAVPG